MHFDKTLSKSVNFTIEIGHRNSPSSYRDWNEEEWHHFGFYDEISNCYKKYSLHVKKFIKTESNCNEIGGL